MIHTIITHPGSAHKDDFLACCLLVAVHGVPIVRREPTQADLDDAQICVVDVGGVHDEAMMNFDHHQFAADSPPICALSLVMKHLGVYENARLFCDWLEPVEMFDTRGPVKTAEWLGISRDSLGKLQSTIDVTILRRFAFCHRLEKGNLIWELMQVIGNDLLYYLRTMAEKLEVLSENLEFWDIEKEGEVFSAVFLARSESMVDDPSGGMSRYLKSIGRDQDVVAMIYPDRRGSGYGLSRNNDNERLNFTQIQEYDDVHFAHPRGFVAKTSATSIERLRELLNDSWV
jgi:Uncharacterised protein family (UPF0160)